MAKKDVREKIQDMKDELATLKEHYSEAKGALNSKMKVLKDTFGYSSIAEAKRKLVVMEKDLSLMEKELESKIEGYLKKYVEVLK